jgi:hypothetical protein
VSLKQFVHEAGPVVEDTQTCTRCGYCLAEPGYSTWEVGAHVLHVETPRGLKGFTVVTLVEELPVGATICGRVR